MVNARLCETAIARHFDFVNCETETSKRFKLMRVRDFRFKPQSLNKIQISSDEKTSKFIKTNKQTNREFD